MFFLNYKIFIKKNWDRIILSLLTLTYFFILNSLATARHNAFASRFDLSNMDQTLWFTLHGHFFSLRYPEEILSRFAVHADLILILLSPLYLIKDDVRMLIAAQSFFLAAGAIPTYFLSLKVLKDKTVSILLVTIYLLNPGLQWTNIYDFHGIALTIPFLLAMFYFAHVRKWTWYWIFLSLAIITKEQVSLTIAIFGIFIFFMFKKKRIGITTTAIGLIWFFTMVYIIIPHFTPNGIHWALESYGETNMLQLLNKISSSFALGNFVQKSSIDYYFILLKPFSFLPLLGMPWILLSAPELAINIVRGTKTIFFHYDSGIIPGIVISTVYGLGHFQVILKTLGLKSVHIKIATLLVALGMLGVAIRVNYHYSPLPTTPSCWCRIYNVTSEDKAFEKALQNIPKDASITSSLEIRPHINHRMYAFSIPSATESADFIATIDQNRIPGNFEAKDIENKLIPILLSGNTHEVIFRSDHFYLFEKIKKGDNKVNFPK